VASPFNFEVKGFSHHIWGQPLIDSLNAGGIQVVHMTNEQAISDFPRTVEGLSEYNVVIISDCECEVLALYPFWIAGTPLPRTNRLKAIREYTRNGGGLLMVVAGPPSAGALATRGITTPGRRSVAVTCMKGLDDRVETPEGVHVNIKQPITRC